MPIATVPPDEQKTLVMKQKKTTQVERPVYHEAPMQGGKNWAAILLVVLLLAGMAGAGGWFLYNLGIIGPKIVRVPKVIGETLDTAKLDLEGRNLKIKRASEEYNKEIKKGIVISQDPQPGSELEEGKEVSVIISKGPKMVAVPDVSGLRSAEAAAKLTRAGFDTRNKEDQVISTEPDVGEEVPEGSKVTLVISEGPQILSVPDVQGNTADKAKSTLTGFKVTVKEEFSDTVSKGTVTRMIPSAGSEVKKGSAVTIYVSKGPEMKAVPDVAGKLEDEAAEILANDGFAIDVQDVPNVPAENDGKVVGQKPEAGSQQVKGTKVTIYVGKAGD
jgi:serine/threonine-protein kinase